MLSVTIVAIFFLSCGTLYGLWKLLPLLDKEALTLTVIILLLFSVASIGANRVSLTKLKYAETQYNKCRAAYSDVHLIALNFQNYLIEHGAIEQPTEPEKVKVYGPLPVRTIGLTQWRGQPLEMRHTTTHEYMVNRQKQIDERETSSVD